MTTMMKGTDVSRATMEVPDNSEPLLLHIDGYKCFPTLDASLNMVFGGISKLIPINRHALAEFSNYFYNLFFGPLAILNNRKDSKGNPIIDVHEDPNFDFGQFTFMIHATLRMGTNLDELTNIKLVWKIEDKNRIIALLKLGVKYQLEMFAKFAEKALIGLGAGTMELLALADQFTMAALKQHCLNTVTPSAIKFWKYFVKNNYQRLTPATQKQLVAKLKLEVLNAHARHKQIRELREIASRERQKVKQRNNSQWSEKARHPCPWGAGSNYYGHDRRWKERKQQSYEQQRGINR